MLWAAPLLPSEPCQGLVHAGGAALSLHPFLWEARERLPAEKKEEQVSGQTWPRGNKTGT